jgi:hypothetical protein
MRRIPAIGQFSQPRHVVPGSALGSNSRLWFPVLSRFDSLSQLVPAANLRSRLYFRCTSLAG